jgi:hypothetical protein
VPSGGCCCYAWGCCCWPCLLPHASCKEFEHKRF